MFPRGPLWQGLVIDDYFVISRERASAKSSQAESVRRLEEAEKINEAAGVFGSDDKTIRGAESFKVIGAEVLADARTRSAGIVSVAAPLSKRVPMMMLSLRTAALPFISRTLASRLAGNWISVLTYRRCLCCLLSNLFSYGTKAAADGSDVLPMPRRVAEELVLASIFGLCAATDISVPYDNYIYATDASNAKGAVTLREVGPEISEILWLGGDKKGAYTMLDAPARATLRSLGEDCDGEPAIADFSDGPAKALPFEFDFVEIFGGSGVLSKAVVQMGFSSCTPIDLSNSPHHDIGNYKLVDWIFQMIKEKRFRSLACEPPCTTFSPAQHPASRSYRCPLGFDRKEPKTYLGNLLAFRSFAILWFAWRCGTPSLLETPFLSKLAWLTTWAFLKKLGFEEAVLNSCALGSIHKKPFRLLGYGLDMEMLRIPCPGGHSHVRIEGKLTKASAVYHPGVAHRIAECFAKALKSSKSDDAVSATSLESVVINDLLLQEGWQTFAHWWWSKPGHINIFESRAFVGLERRLLDLGGDRRFTALLDSRVAKGAHAKGRSSSRALRPSLLRSCSYQIAGNIYPSFGFAPTRINTADAPSRDRDFPEAADHSLISALTPEEISSLHSRQFSRANANWIRLCLLVFICLCPGANAVTGDRPFSCTFPGFGILLASFILGLCIFSISRLPHSSVGLSHDFSATWTSVKGAPWKPPHPQNFWVGTSHCHVIAVWAALHLPPVHAMPMYPANKDEASRAERRAGNVLQADRVVLQSTRDRRDHLLIAFDRWLNEH